MQTVAVIVLNWNKAEQTRHCLEVARRATARPVHWIVVDNGSDEPIGSLQPDVTLIRLPRNLGFAGGANLGLRHAFAAGADKAWLLNNDAEPQPGALDALLAAVEADPGIGLASPVILDADADAGEVVGFHGGLLTACGDRITCDAAEYARWASAWPDRIWLVGTALLVARPVFERTGGFDESLFAYWEDNDLSRRSAVAGFRNVVVAGAEVRHEAPRPAERPPYYHYFMTRNELLLLHKVGFTGMLRPAWWALRRAVRLHRHLAGSRDRRRAVRRGVLDGLMRRGGPYRES